MKEATLNGLEPLFSGAEIEAVMGLWEDHESRYSIMRSLGQRLLASNEILGSPHEQIKILVSQARFADSEEECMYVASIIWSHMRDMDILPKLESTLQDIDAPRQKNESALRTFAERGFVSIGILGSAMDYRYKRRGMPSKSYYEMNVKRAFLVLGEKSISEHVEPWTALMGEFFCC